MNTVNYGAIVVAALSSFVLGGFWYSPKGFLNAWMRESKIRPEEKREGQKHGARPFVVSFVFALAASTLFGIFVPHENLTAAMAGAAVVGVGWVFCSFGINYQLGGKSVKLLAIDGGYHIIQFLLFGLIQGLWH